MQLNPSEISDLLKKRIEGLGVSADLRTQGTVVSVTDGICRVHGLSDVMQGEMLEFPGNTYGLALNLERDSVGAVILGSYEHISEGDLVKTTGKILSVPVGPELIGRVVNALGQPIDGKGLMRISGDEDITVDLKLQMPRNVVYDFDTSELRLVSDLSTITYAGKQSVSYTILYPSKVSSSSVKVESPTIRTVQVEIGELNKKDIEIRCKVVGNVAEGYIAGTVEMLPETLEVRGQQADIMQISYAQVTLDIENASSTVVKLLDYELYDFNDQLIESKNIHPMSENVQVTMPVLKVKDVPLTVNFIESAGSRLENYTYTLSHSSITLSGDATQMAGISEISLGTLALEDVQGSETLTYDILIPDGVNNLSGITSATLTISSGDISTKEVEATHFSYENFSGDHTVTVVTSSLPVTLRGSASDLEAIYGSEVHVIADLSDIAADSGSYTVPARIEVSGYDVGAVGTYEVTVHIS